MIDRDFDRKGGRRAIAVLIGFVLLIPIVIATIAHRMLRAPAPPAPLVAPRVASDQREAPTPVLVPTAAPLEDLPKLEDSDPFVRKLAEVLSANPQWAKWLLSDGLVRRLTASIDNVAEGRSPKAHLAFLAPQGAFLVHEQRDSTTIDAASYRRYDLFADVVASLDAKGCARLYEDTRPLFQEAYRELGYPDRDFDQTLSKAIHVLLATPEPGGDVAVRESVKSWKLADPQLESLAPAQKQLLRMGPDNVRKVQEKLHEVAEALNLAV